MSLLFFPELFYQIITNLDDKEKIFLTSCSKITYNFKLLLILDSEYNLEEINDKWRVKHILIKEYILENEINELIKNLISESIVINQKYVEFISNNTNIKLSHNREIIKKLLSHGHYYLAIKIILNIIDNIDKINEQFGYSDIAKLLVDLGADIHAQDNRAIIMVTYDDHVDIVKLLVDSGANVHSQNSQAIILASNDHLSVVKLLTKLGEDVRSQNNRSITTSSLHYGPFSMVKLSIDSGADIRTQNNQAIIYASLKGYLSVVTNSGFSKIVPISSSLLASSETNAQALKYTEVNKYSDIIELIKKLIVDHW